MAGQGKWLKVFTSLNNYKSTLLNRLSVTNFQQPNAGLKQETKDKLKKLNIPEQPKRPHTPYIRFVNEHRLIVQKQHPDWKLIEVTKQCAQDWNNISPAVKEKYQQEYNVAAQEYLQQNKAFNASLTDEQLQILQSAKKERKNDKKKRSLRKKFREAGKPKRPMGSFLHFIKEKIDLPENKNKKFSDMLSKYAEEWKVLPEQQKQKYKDLFNADKKRYEVEMENWEIKMVKQGNTDIIRKESQIINVKPKHLEKPGKDTSMETNLQKHTQNNKKEMNSFKFDEQKIQQISSSEQGRTGLPELRDRNKEADISHQQLHENVNKESSKKDTMLNRIKNIFKF